MIKEIPGFPGYYADKQGNVWSSRRLGLRKLSPALHPNGYFHLLVYKNSRPYNRKNSRLVLETFVGPCPEGM